MASVNNPEDQEQNQQAGAPVTVSGTGGASSGGGQGAGGGATPSAPASPVSQNIAPQNNAGYVDVGTYLDANQGGSQQLGTAVSNNLINDYNTAKSGVDKSAQAATNAANTGYTHANTDLIQQVENNPVAAAADPNQLSAFQAQLNDTYTGPTNWSDLGAQQGNVAAAQQEGNLVNTPGGLNVLTQKVEGQTGQGQSQGINQLDTLLLGASPAAYGAVQAASDPYKGLTDYLNTQNTGVTNAITAGQAGAQQASKQALDAFTGSNGALTNLNSTINSTTADKVAAAQTQQAQLKADLAKLYSQPLDTSSTTLGTYGGGTTPWYNSTNYSVGDLSPQDVQALGLTPDQWSGLRSALQTAGTSQYMTGHNFGAASPTSQIDIGQWLNQQDPTAAITAGTVATPEQYQQMTAIQQLLGDKTPQGNAINPALASLAGTAPANTNSFDYKTALDNANSVSAQERQAAQDEANLLASNADQAHAASKHGGFLDKANLPLKYLANPLLTVPDQLKAVKK